MIKNAKVVSINTDAGIYHKQSAERGTPEFIMSVSSLKNFNQCPSRFFSGYELPKSVAKDDGSLFDCRLLTPDAFHFKYAIKPETYTNDKGEEKPWNANSNVCKEWLEENSELESISKKQVDESEEAIKAFRRDEVIAAFLDASDKQVAIAAEWHDEKTELKIGLRSLLDLVPRVDTEFSKCVGDVKRTRSAALMPWQRWCYSAGYYVQAAFYLDMLVLAGGGDRTDFCFLLSESYPPWQSGKRLLSQDFLDLGRADYKQWLANYCWCLKNNRWPSYDETDEAIQGAWSLVSPEPWMATRGQFAPKFIMEIEEEEPQPESIDVTP